MDRTRSHRRSPQGISLVEALVAITLLGAAALYMAQSAMQGMRAQRKVASLGEIEELRQFLRMGIDCGRSLQGFATASGFPVGCHSGAGGVELRRANNTVLVASPLGQVGEYDLQVTCPGPGPAGCGAAAPGSPPCGQGLNFLYRNRNRAAEQDWKGLFGTNPAPCAYVFGGGAIPASTAQGAQNVAAPDCPSTNVGGLCDSAWQADVVFPVPFKAPPVVLVSPSQMSSQGGCVGNATDHTYAMAQNITATGFRMRCAGSPNAGTCGAYGGWYSRALCSWMAVGP